MTSVNGKASEPNEVVSAAPEVSSSSTTPSLPRPSPKQGRDAMYAYPAPIRTFPLPTFFPNNPISLLHLAYEWARQVFFPPPAEPSVIHIGVWDPHTRSVRIDDLQSIRALWEQGFFGKGSLSRSEPNWLKREHNRRSASTGANVSEERTEARREARRIAKWERAAAELEAIEQQRREEAALHATPEPVSVLPPSTDPTPVDVKAGPKPPAGPAELLALPNSLGAPVLTPTSVINGSQPRAPVCPSGLLALPNSLADLVTISQLGKDSPCTNGDANCKLANGRAQPIGLVNDVNGCAPEASASKVSEVNGLGLNGATTTSNGLVSPAPSLESSDGSTESTGAQAKESQPMKRRKSVRFAPTVESTTFQHHDPPSPRSANSSPPKSASPPLANGACVTNAPPVVPAASPALVLDSNLASAINGGELQNKEHFQLAPVEAFFLVFAMGALSVVDPVTKAPIPTDELLTLFDGYSSFPPKVDLLSSGLQPQDPFLLDYAVYHHFRSLGWVPRHGIKFGVDFLLYERGPVFDHAHFGVMIMPSFTDGRWAGYEHKVPKKTWSWLMGVNRVMAHVIKNLALVYVDIPPPPVFDEAMRKGGLAAALKKYKIREVMVRRFSVNRNR